MYRKHVNMYNNNGLFIQCIQFFETFWEKLDISLYVNQCSLSSFQVLSYLDTF